MSLPTWIWYYGDFEIRQRLLVDSRRFGHDWFYAAPFCLDDCRHNVLFERSVTLKREERVFIRLDGFGYVKLDGVRVRYDEGLLVPAGEHTISIGVTNTTGLPSIFVSGDTVVSDGNWVSSIDFIHKTPVGYWNLNDPDTPPSRFSLPRRPITLQKISEAGVTLYDAGCETFCAVTLQLSGEGEGALYYGESVAECLSEESYIKTRVRPDENGCFSMPPLAFRYLRFVGEGLTLTDISAELEYLPQEWRGSFRCSDERLNKIYAVSEYTLALNSREFFLDGIKRDRYIWSGDAYQSYLLNYYAAFDSALCRRTMLALGGNTAPIQHINRINDYTAYFLIAVEDYYRYTGDLDFLSRIYPRMLAWVDFILGRTDERGFVVPRDGDWIFIDWLDTLDKEGANATEQILLAKALRSVAKVGALIGQDTAEYTARADALCALIEKEFWDEEKGAYIDSADSHRRVVNRHASIMAIRFGLVDEKRREIILRSVLNNDEIPAIKTPYFKFYELESLCMQQKHDEVLRRMREYWGGMLDLGATTFWEEYDPSLPDDAHYSMYGMPYGKSLCHAWGASPIYLLGRFFLGVTPTEDGYAAYTVAPALGDLDFIEGRVPTPRGDISVYMDRREVRVKSTVAGGTLVVGDAVYPIPTDRELCVKFS